MLHYIIDGNNLIGKIKPLFKLQQKDSQAARGSLVFIINKFLIAKKINLTLHLDGFHILPLYLTKGKIIYSERKTADEKIREEINNSKNPRILTLVTSDHELINYARVNSVKVISSEDFLNELKSIRKENDEEKKIDELKKENKNFLKLFSN